MSPDGKLYTEVAKLTATPMVYASLVGDNQGLATQIASTLLAGASPVLAYDDVSGLNGPPETCMNGYENHVSSYYWSLEYVKLVPVGGPVPGRKTHTPAPLQIKMLLKPIDINDRPLYNIIGSFVVCLSTSIREREAVREVRDELGLPKGIVLEERSTRSSDTS